MGLYKAGTKVRLKADFLRSIGCYTGALPFAIGVILRTEPLGDRTICDIKWINDYANEISLTRILNTNLEVI